jgi:hypothetical protein
VGAQNVYPEDKGAFTGAVRVTVSVSSGNVGPASVNWSPWARVEIDGRPAQTTPCRFDDLRPGRYEVRLTHPGFKDEVTGAPCNEYAVCMGEPCQKQYGATITRTDKKPFPAGTYTLSIWGEDRSVVKTLTIK